jgi:hypothetical protein
MATDVRRFEDVSQLEGVRQQLAGSADADWGNQAARDTANSADGGRAAIRKVEGRQSRPSDLTP